MSDSPALQTLATPRGMARVELHGQPGADRLLVLGHGAGGGVGAPDLTAATRAAASLGWSVALVEQPWRVAGRRVAEAPARLDEAWTAVVAALPRPRLLVLGGRSAGARVACRTAGPLGAQAVLALAFPLVAPNGRSRADELLLPGVPRLVVQGGRDAFGVPEQADGVTVHVVAGADHSFAVRRADGRSRREVLEEVRERVAGWLQTLT
jgi:hypothetical protein